ncbi:hypothetical protein P175DRAFT_0503714, partial [Aspergillus ochraceoroseus IBT 24754]
MPEAYFMMQIDWAKKKTSFFFFFFFLSIYRIFPIMRDVLKVFTENWLRRVRKKKTPPVTCCLLRV